MPTVRRCHFDDGLNFVGGLLHLVARDDVAEKLDFLRGDRTLRWGHLEVGPIEDEADLIHIKLVPFERLGEDDDVIEIHDDVIPPPVRQELVHCPLESMRGVHEALS
ncbi:unnamed protein product [Didymodactylos carnosus]|uniref:Uncharacterized protein n=1 Tax=Didymodactylos carnosus TaxID=1234261 RepID=A0A814A1U6_9BILA|nr:unnamed protein product [Didymodactylos carnosus]CAF3688352.1 unnamed protein product [Didymodactylos carnosus]